MTFFFLENTMLSNIPLIDEQHQRLLEAANAFFVCFENGHARKQIPETLAFLRQYIQYHFSAEEAFQKTSGYPLYREHQVQHQALGMQVQFHAVAMAESQHSYATVLAFNNFVKDWILVHLMDYDLDFARFYKTTKTE